jgi:hypothetical protein
LSGHFLPRDLGDLLRRADAATTSSPWALIRIRREPLLAGRRAGEGNASRWVSPILPNTLPALTAVLAFRNGVQTPVVMARAFIHNRTPRRSRPKAGRRLRGKRSPFLLANAP